MAYKPLNPVVASLSPNVYNAVQNTPMSDADKNMIEQLSFAYAKGTELKKLDPALAAKKFQALSKPAQQDVRYLYPNEAFTKEQQSLLGKLVGGVVHTGVKAAELAISPLIGMYSAMGQYTKAINTPVRTAFQVVTQQKPVFSGKTWSTAYQGKDLYNQTDVDALNKKYGAETAHVAMGIVAGQTPGEIFASWNNGKPDNALFDAYSKFLNNPKEMTPVIDETKMARFSPGRSVARNEVSTNPNPILHAFTTLIFGKQLPTVRIQGESDAAYKKRQAADTAAYQKKVSGVTDAMYQLVIDPMTYATMGLNKLAISSSKLAPLADKIASKIQFGDYMTERLRQAAQNGKWEESVADTFTRPQVKDLWDKTAGPAIKQLAEAKNAAERSLALNNIRRNVPAYNEPEVLATLVKGKVFDAPSAERFFTNYENAHYLLSGRTDNTTFYRNGIATARNQRQLTQGIALAAESFFNPVVGRSSVRKTVEELQNAGEQGWKIISTLGEQEDSFINPLTSTIKKYDDEITKAQEIGFKLGNLARRAQGNGHIRIGDDAWKTARSFYLRAATVFPSDVAKVVTDMFVHAPIDEQRNAVYQLYTASMQNRGVGGSVGGENFIRKTLSKIFNTDSGFGITPDLEISHEFANAAGANVARWENDVPKIVNIGAIQPSQITFALAALDDQAVNTFAAMTKDKNSIPALFDGFVQHKWVQNFTDFWSFFNLFPRLGSRTAIDHGTFFVAVAPKDDIVRYISGGAKKTGDYLNMVTGSKDAVGPFERLFHKALKRGGPEDFLTAEKRQKIVEELVDKTSKEMGRPVPVEEINHALIRAEVAQRAHEILFGQYDVVVPISDVKKITSLLEEQSAKGFNATKYPNKLASLEKYTTGTHPIYPTVNNYLRGVLKLQGKELNNEVKTVVKDIDELMKAAPGLESPIITYRGITNKDFSDQLLKLEPGDKFTEKAFSSTSFNIETAIRFGGFAKGVMLKITNPAGTKGIHPNSFAPGIIKNAEQEWILPRNTTFKVTKINQNVIEVEVVNKGAKPVTPVVTQEMLQEKEALINLFKYEPNYLEAQVSSLSSRANMSGAFVEEAARKPIFTESSLDKALKEVNERYAKELKKGKVKELKITSNWEPRTAKELKDIAGNDDLFALAHMHNWSIRFAYNKVKFATDRGEYTFSPVEEFFNNNGLRTIRDFENATTQLLRKVGVKYNNPVDFVLEDPDRLSRFVRLWSGLYASMKQEARSDVEIADTIIKTMLIDMREAFHGSTETTVFNEKLFDRIAEEYDKLAALDKPNRPMPNKWAKAAAKIEFPEFAKLTEGKRPQVLNTAINFPGGAIAEMDGVQGFMGKFGYAAYEQMDRQVNAFFTQKALATTYLRIYKANLPFRDGFIKQQAALMKKANPSWSDETILKTVKELADKRFTSIAINDASNTLLKYIDNQAIRSNFAVSFRTVGRYYRANEDFMRRVYRMVKDKPLRTLYRTRLLHTAVDAYGGTYKDDNGKDYLIFPSDTIFNHAVAPFLNAFTPDDPAYQIPQFNNFKMKLELINPSFSQDAGAMTLSSPAGTLAVLATRGIIGIRTVFGNDIPYAAQREKAGDLLAQVFLGSTGKSLALNSKNWTEAVMPLFLKNFYNMADRSDANQQFVSASMSAAAYLQAYGHGLPSPQDPDYTKKLAIAQKNLKIAAGNILVARWLLGMGPVSMSLQESKGLPDYMLKSGDVSLRGEFFKILQGISDKYGNTVQDPYALATAIFIGQNPGKSIYTVSRSNKAYSVVVKNTQSMKDWALNNMSFINSFDQSGAAWVFAPQAGDFNATVYGWMQAQDLINIPKFEDYLQTVALNNDRNEYFKIGKEEQAALAKTTDLTLRKNIIDNAANARQSLKASNSMLEGALKKGLNVRGDVLQAYKDIKSIVSDNTTPINKKDRVVMRQAIAQMDSYLDVVSYGNPYSQMANYSEIKQQAEDRVDGELQKLVNLSPAVAQAYNYVFKSIFTSYNPDTAQVIKRG